MKNSDSSTIGSEKREELSGLDAMNALLLRLNENLESYFPGFAKGKTSIKGTPLGGQYAKTFKFELSADGKKRYAFAKICPVFESLDPARMEFETLKILYNKIKERDSALAVSRPIDYFPDINSYMMESVGSMDMRTYLLINNSVISDGKKMAQLNDKIKGSARWLQTFHLLTRSVDTQKFDSSAFLSSITDEFDYKMIWEFPFKQNTLDRLSGVFRELSQLSGRISMLCAKWHWDYTPGHIFLDNDKFSVIDILGIDNTPVYEDVGRFTAALTSINSLPFHPLYSYRRASRQLSSEFISAYLKGTGIILEEGLLMSNIYRLKHLLFFFNGQYVLISNRIHPLAADLYMRLRGLRNFEMAMVDTIDAIETGLNEYKIKDAGHLNSKVTP